MKFASLTLQLNLYNHTFVPDFYLIFLIFFILLVFLYLLDCFDKILSCSVLLLLIITQYDTTTPNYIYYTNMLFD